MNPEFSVLFEPHEFRCGIRATNRIVMAPMTTWSSHRDGTIHPDEIEYLRRRATGPGTVITAACYVNPEGHAFPGQWSCHADEMLPSLRAVADTIHSRGSLAVLQIHHGGRMCPASLLGHTPISASAIPAPRPDADTPREMTDAEIRDTIDDFARATNRAIISGYDGVEIHGANTYLQQQFFSPHSNRRNDVWGGSLAARKRFPLACADAVLDAARLATRPFAVGYRLSPEEIEEPGITIDDTLQLVDALCERPLDYLHVSVRHYMKGSIRVPSDMRRPTSRILDHVAGRMPVIGVGRVVTPDEALFILRDGCALVALGRTLLLEPEWCEKIASGRETEIRTALPTAGGEALLTLPSQLYARLMQVQGWVPLAT